MRGKNAHRPTVRRTQHLEITFGNYLLVKCIISFELWISYDSDLCESINERYEEIVRFAFWPTHDFRKVTFNSKEIYSNGNCSICACAFDAGSSDKTFSHLFSNSNERCCNFTLIRTLRFTSILHIYRSPHANWRIRGHDTDDRLLVAVHKLSFTSMAEMKRNN